MLYFLPVLLLEKVLQIASSMQHLQHLLLHGVLPVLVGGVGVVTLARTSRSLRLWGCLKATIGGLGMAFWSLWEVCKIGKCFCSILVRLVREG